jgi:hypothetical protein
MSGIIDLASALIELLHHFPLLYLNLRRRARGSCEESRAFSEKDVFQFQLFVRIRLVHVKNQGKPIPEPPLDSIPQEQPLWKVVCLDYLAPTV